MSDTIDGDGELMDDSDVEINDETDGFEEEEVEDFDVLDDDDDIDDVDDEDAEAVEPAAPRARRGEAKVGVLRRLYRGETKFDFIGRRKIWYLISALIIVIGIGSISARGLNLGIDFKGGSSWEVPVAASVTQSQAVTVANSLGLNQPVVEILGAAGSKNVLVEADLNSLSPTLQTKESAEVVAALAKLGNTNADNVSVTHVGPTWGGQITHRALLALVLFFIAIVVYISLRFEWKMAVAAVIAVIHDVLVTVGVYSIFGFQVTPDTVVAVLTILGYSLYDTVVVFDRVAENTKGLGASGRITYSEMVNLSMNQTLARSINTSLVAVLPVLSVLVVGAEFLGATALQYYGLALFVGLCSGAYSSIFIASPVLAQLKEREPRYVTIRQRLETRGDRLGVLTPSAAALLNNVATTPGGKAARAERTGTLRPGVAATKAPAAKAPAARTATPTKSAAGRPAPGGARRPPAKRSKKKRRR